MFSLTLGYPGLALAVLGILISLACNSQPERTPITQTAPTPLVTLNTASAATPEPKPSPVHATPMTPAEAPTLAPTPTPVPAPPSTLMPSESPEPPTPTTAIPPATSTSAETDREALIAFYWATDGPNWRHNGNWLTDAPLGDWYGAQTGKGGRVDSLSLDDNLLSGEVPPQFGNLDRLEFLSLRGNRLNGEIPPELSGLVNLKWLDLSTNQLGGDIPAELGTLANLRHVYLGRNQLSGQIPWELGNLDYRVELLLRGNEFSGCLPDSVHSLLYYWDEPRGTEQELGLPLCRYAGHPGERDVVESLYGMIKDPGWEEYQDALRHEPIAQWPGVTVDGDGRVMKLELYWFDGIHGDLPPGLGRLSSLQVLIIDAEALTGEIPPELGQLSGLRVLVLSGGDLSGPVPHQLGNLGNLRQLMLSGHQLNGEIPPELGRLNNLRDLFLDGNRLSGEIPSDLGDLENLERLVLSSNNLSGEVSPELGNLGNLQWLDIAGNQLSGHLPPELGNLEKLQWIQISGNQQLIGCVPDNLYINGNTHLPYCGSNGSPTAPADTMEPAPTPWVTPATEPVPTGTPAPSPTPDESLPLQHGEWHTWKENVYGGWDSDLGYDFISTVRATEYFVGEAEVELRAVCFADLISPDTGEISWPLRFGLYLDEIYDREEDVERAGIAKTGYLSVLIAHDGVAIWRGEWVAQSEERYSHPYMLRRTAFHGDEDVSRHLARELARRDQGYVSVSLNEEGTEGQTINRVFWFHLEGAKEAITPLLQICADRRG